MSNISTYDIAWVVIQKDRWLPEKLQRARAFLSSIYPYLSPRRKAQVARIGVFDALQVGGS